ncbi:MAG: hypothetical protein HXY43_09045 [Fischerella sp.]|nr:hypothetical protein [Fischerella sp.]NWF59435.1 hypothetical protein [Fischerella sp.]
MTNQRKFSLLVVQKLVYSSPKSFVKNNIPDFSPEVKDLYPNQIGLL